MEQSKGLDGGTLKLMAAALMLIDHVGAILLPETVILRCIGRLAFPVFAFFIAEGYAHTRSFGRYLLRMAIWAAVSEIPFNLEFGHFFVPGRQNVLWTFCLALLSLRGLDRLHHHFNFMISYISTISISFCRCYFVLLCGRVIPIFIPTLLIICLMKSFVIIRQQTFSC